MKVSQTVRLLLLLWLPAGVLTPVFSADTLLEFQACFKPIAQSGSQSFPPYFPLLPHAWLQSNGTNCYSLCICYAFFISLMLVLLEMPVTVLHWPPTLSNSSQISDHPNHLSFQSGTSTFSMMLLLIQRRSYKQAHTFDFWEHFICISPGALLQNSNVNEQINSVSSIIKDLCIFSVIVPLSLI